MKVYVITPLSKGYRVDALDPDTKESKESGHTTRKHAINHCMQEIPKERAFQIVLLDEDK